MHIGDTITCTYVQCICNAHGHYAVKRTDMCTHTVVAHTLVAPGIGAQCACTYFSHLSSRFVATETFVQPPEN